VTYILFACPIPETALEFYRVVMAIPEGARARIIALHDEMVIWEAIP